MKLFDLCLLFSLAQAKYLDTRIQQGEYVEHKNKKQEVILIGDCIFEGNEFLPKLINNDKRMMINYGVSGATISKEDQKPMLLTTEFELVQNSTPDIVVIMLGTNDIFSHRKMDEKKLYDEYTELVKAVKKLKSHPQIFLTIPPPVYPTYDDGTFTKLIMANEQIKTDIANVILPKIIPEVAAKEGIPQDHVINVYKALGDGDSTKKLLMCKDQEKICGAPADCDGVHPSERGMQLIAQTITDAISK